MRRARWLAAWRKSSVRPVFYHVISRVVDRRFVFGVDEKEKFRTLMRLQEKFTGCRAVSYCLMDNHFHILLEVPPMAEGGLSDKDLLKRLSAIYSEAFVAEVAKELMEARSANDADGNGTGSVSVSVSGTNSSSEAAGSGSGTGTRLDAAVGAIHQRFSYRMHDLGEFMKGLLQRFTQWFNRRQSRTGRLWEDRFRSVIVEDGVAAKTIAAYIDLNPVRAGMVKDPADYRWCSYGEAIGGGAKGNGKTARAGLVRALRAHQGIGADADLWASGVAREYRKLLMAGAVGRTSESIGKDGRVVSKTLRKGLSKEKVAEEKAKDGELSLGKALRCRIRYFTDGAVIGSKEFVNEAFASARERFGARRKDGARAMRGSGSAARGLLWSVRDLRVRI